MDCPGGEKGAVQGPAGPLVSGGDGGLVGEGRDGEVGPRRREEGRQRAGLAGAAGVAAAMSLMLPPLELLPPQAARPRHIRTARARDTSFFIAIFLS